MPLDSQSQIKSLANPEFALAYSRRGCLTPAMASPAGDTNQGIRYSGSHIKCKPKCPAVLQLCDSPAQGSQDPVC